MRKILSGLCLLQLQLIFISTANSEPLVPHEGNRTPSSRRRNPDFHRRVAPLAVLKKRLREGKTKEARKMAAIDLRKYGHLSSVDTLIEALNREPELEVREEVLATLSEMGISARRNSKAYAETLAKAIPTLTKILEKHNGLSRYKVINLIEDIRAAKGDVSAAIPALAKMVEEKTWMSHRAAVVLGYIGPGARAAIPQLIKALERSKLDSYLIESAAVALGQMGRHGEPALPALRTALGKVNKKIANLYYRDRELESLKWSIDRSITKIKLALRN